MVSSKYGVSQTKEKALLERMDKIGLKESDIQESFIRSSGKGGQNVNKVSTCVYLKHLPSGLEVKCQRGRSQSLNRFVARRLLVDKLESILLGHKSMEQQKISKIRRQKRKRSKRAKEKVLEAKHQRSQIKQTRHKIVPDGNL